MIDHRFAYSVKIVQSCSFLMSRKFEMYKDCQWYGAERLKIFHSNAKLKTVSEELFFRIISVFGKGMVEQGLG